MSIKFIVVGCQFLVNDDNLVQLATKNRKLKTIFSFPLPDTVPFVITRRLWPGW